MRLLPRSLSGRLLVTALVALVFAMAFATFAIGGVLERFIMHNLDERLDVQIAVVARAVRPDGALDRSLAVDVPPYNRPGSGWVWQINAPGGVIASESLGEQRIAPELAPRRRQRAYRRNRPRPLAFEAVIADGTRVHGRALMIATSAGPARVFAAGPQREVERPLRAAWIPLLVSLGVLGGALAGALIIQLQLGLRPLRRISGMLAEVRAGERRHIDVDEPTELLPLVTELNALIDASDAAITRARGHVANLAHGLKTPLAALRLDLAEPGRDPDGKLTEQVARLEEQVRHHLSRARTAAPEGPPAPAIELAPHVNDLVDALSAIHSSRPIVADIAITDGLKVRCDPQDLDELLGNLLDNGWRHAESRVTVSAEPNGALARIVIDDDGPGLSPALLERLAEGRRLDEEADRNGFGTRIARELAELHGGDIAWGAAPGGGTRVTVSLRRG